MTVKDFFEQTMDSQMTESTYNIRRPRPRVFCKDGFNISIQANRTAYCRPRENDLVDYESVELGYPNKLDDLIADYAEVFGTTGTVFGYVPVNLVNELLEKHGGIDYWDYSSSV